MSNLSPDQFGDYDFEHTHSRFGFHMLRANHPDTPKGIASAGYIKWHDDGEIGNLSVHESFQRRGLATEMFRRAKEIDPNVRHSDTISEEGKAWRDSLNR